MPYQKHKKPSEKMLKVVALLEENPNMTPTEAGRQAGYAPNTVKNIGKNVMNKPLVKSLLDNYRYELEKHGINPQRLAKKMDELLDASDPIITMTGVLRDKEGNIITKKDRKTQLVAMKLLHDVYQVNIKETEGLKRRLTIEEFEEKEGIIDIIDD